MRNAIKSKKLNIEKGQKVRLRCYNSIKKLNKGEKGMKAKSELFKGKKYDIKLYSYNRKFEVINAVNKEDNSILQYDYNHGAVLFWDKNNLDGDPYEYMYNALISKGLTKFKKLLIEWGEDPNIVQQVVFRAIDIIAKERGN